MIRWVNYSPCGKHLISISDDSTFVWNLQKESAQKGASIPADEPKEDGFTPVACLSRGGQMAAICRGNLSLTLYNVSGSSASKKEERDV